jgi:phasin family protein
MTVKSKTGKAGDEFSRIEEAVTATTKQSVNTAMKAGNETMEKAMGFQKQGFEALSKNFDEIVKLNRQAVESMVVAGTAASKGIETLSAENLAFAKSRFDESVGSAKALFGARTLQEVVELQTDISRSAFDAFMAQTTKVGEMTAKLAQEAFAPINAQIQAAVEKMVKPATY